MDSQRPGANGSLSSLFTGKKAKWLPLYQRLLARLTRIPGIEVRPGRSVIALELTDASAAQMAQIRVTSTGLECRLALPKAQLKSPRLKPVTTQTRPKMSHRTVLAAPGDLDDELMLWLKAAKRSVERA